MQPVIVGTHIQVDVPYMQREKAKGVPGARWNASVKAWMFPLSQATMVRLLFPWTSSVLAEYTKTDSGTSDKIDLGFDIVSDDTPYVDLFRDFHLGAYKFQRKPYDHQVKAMKGILSKKQYALFMEMGTGKSAAVVWAFDWLKQCGRARRMLIICPKTLIKNWQNEVAMCTKGMSVLAADMTGPKRELALRDSKDDVVIINYDGFMALKSCEWLWNTFDFVCLDESQYIKSYDAQRTKKIVDTFAHRDIYKVIATGTPITQNVLDVYMQFKFLNPAFININSYYAFRGRYCTMGGYGGYQVVGYKNVPDLKKILGQHSIQVKKDDCLDLPAKIYSVRRLDMPKTLKDQYKAMRDEMMIEFAKDGGIEEVSATIALTKMLRLQEILAGHYIEDKDNLKLQALKDLVIECRDNDEQLVIFCNFRKSIENIKLMLEDMKIATSIIHGDICDREDQVKRFQSGACTVFIGSLAAASAGLTLTKARTMCFFENNFKLVDRIQAEARIHRIGQERKCQYIDLVYNGSIDEHIIKAINEKQEIAEYLIKSFSKMEVGNAA